MEIVPLGESAVIVRLGEHAADGAEVTLDEVLEAQHRIEAAAIAGMVECAPGYASVAVFFDGGRSLDLITERISAALAAPLRRHAQTETRVHDIPVCYEGEFGLDLDEVAQHARLSVSEVVRLHSASEYCVSCIGFMPGFPYLSGLPRELAMARRASPRTEVPAGSVGIGGTHAGIYPTASPGGWNIIGRTPLRLFEVTREQPALLRAGDRVRFRPITSADFHALAGSIDVP